MHCRSVREGSVSSTAVVESLSRWCIDDFPTLLSAAVNISMNTTKALKIKKLHAEGVEERSTSKMHILLRDPGTFPRNTQTVWAMARFQWRTFTQS